MSPPALESEVINAQQLVEEIRRELDPVEQEIRRHPWPGLVGGGKAVVEIEDERRDHAGDDAIW